MVAHHPCQLLLVEVAPSPAGETCTGCIGPNQVISVQHTHSCTQKKKTGSFMTVMEQQTVTGELLAQ